MKWAPSTFLALKLYMVDWVVTPPTVNNNYRRAVRGCDDQFHLKNYQIRNRAIFTAQPPRSRRQPGRHAGRVRTGRGAVLPAVHVKVISEIQ